VQYWSSFSLQNGQIGYQDIALAKEWHDWEARVIYRWHQQQVFVFFNLKAFPSSKFSLDQPDLKRGSQQRAIRDR